MSTIEQVSNCTVVIYVVIYYAAMCGHEQVVDFCLSRRAIVTQEDVSTHRTTPICLSCSFIPLDMECINYRYSHEIEERWTLSSCTGYSEDQREHHQEKDCLINKC